MRREEASLFSSDSILAQGSLHYVSAVWVQVGNGGILIHASFPSRDPWNSCFEFTNNVSLSPIQ